MMKIICTLTPKDGPQIHGIIEEAASPQEMYEVDYSGSAKILPQREKECTVSSLRYFFKDLARELGMEYSETVTGEFETWAE